MSISAAVQARRAALAATEARAQQALLTSYQRVVTATRPARERVLQDVSDAREKGETVDRRWLKRLPSFRDFLAILAVEETLFGQQASEVAGDAQRDALMELQPTDLLGELFSDAPGTIPFASPDPSALFAMVGFTSNGTPLRALLGSASATGVDSARNVLLSGIARQSSMAAVGAQLQTAMGIPLTRAMTITRTEMHRAYREGTRQTMEVNDDLIEGWVWRSARDRRTCEFCEEMHGTFHDTDEMMDTHPNCRCAMVPRAKPYSVILQDPDIPDNRSVAA